MLRAIQEKSVYLLESIVNTLEQYDDIDERPAVFAKKGNKQTETEASSREQPMSDNDDAADDSDAAEPSQ